MELVNIVRQKTLKIWDRFFSVGGIYDDKSPNNYAPMPNLVRPCSLQLSDPSDRQ